MPRYHELLCLQVELLVFRLNVIGFIEQCGSSYSVIQGIREHPANERLVAEYFFILVSNFF